MEPDKPRWEGKVLSFEFETIGKWIEEPEKYVPSGLLQILCWLEMGAPGLDRKWRTHVKKWQGARAQEGRCGDLVSTWRKMEGRERKRGWWRPARQHTAQN